MWNEIANPENPLTLASDVQTLIKQGPVLSPSTESELKPLFLEPYWSTTLYQTAQQLL